MQIQAETLKTALDLRDIVRLMWGAPYRSHHSYNVYHARWRDDGNRPSFTVYATHYKDYGGSGESGDVFSFLQEELNLSFPEALLWVEKHTGTLPDLPRQRTEQRSRPAAQNEPPPADWQRAARDTLRATQRYLWRDEPDAKRVRDYLRHIRGFSDETIQRAGYGYNANWRRVAWQSPETGRHIYLAPGIIEPWETDGALWALRIRCRVGNLAQHLDMPDETGKHGDPLPKYLNLAGSKQSGALYNGDAVKPGGDVLLVEGGFDARLAEQCLRESSQSEIAVVTTGSATNYPGRRRLRQLQQAARVLILMDNDSAGQQAQQQLIESLDGKAVSVQLPAGNDVTDFVMAHHGDLVSLLHDALSPAWWQDGVPDSVRSALLTYFRPVTAPVIEMMNTALHHRLLDPDGFSIQDVLRANQETNFNISDGSIRRVINELTGYFFAKVDTESTTPDSVCNSAKKSRGRPTAIYTIENRARLSDEIVRFAVPRIIEKFHPVDDESGIVAEKLPDLLKRLASRDPEVTFETDFVTEQLEEACEIQGQVQETASKRAQRAMVRLVTGLKQEHSTPLPYENLNTPLRYRAAFLRATNDPDKRRSRREICALLGISNSSVSRIVKRAGLRKLHESGEFEVVDIPRTDNFIRQVQRAARDVRGYPRYLTAILPDARLIRLVFCEDVEEEVAVLYEQGATITVCYQVANHYISVTETLPDPVVNETDKQKTDKQNADPPDDSSSDTPQAAQTAVTPSEGTDEATNTRKRLSRRYFGPSHSPYWIHGQLRLLLLRTGVIRRLPGSETLFVQMSTGDVLDDPDLRTLMNLCNLKNAPPDTYLFR